MKQRDKGLGNPRVDDSIRRNGSKYRIETAGRAAAAAQAEANGGGEWAPSGVTRDQLLRSRERRAAGQIGAQKLAVFMHKGAVYAVQKGCPHLGISLLDGEIDENNVLRCSQHGSSWNLDSGKVDAWLPPSRSGMNIVQRLIEPPCSLKVFETAVRHDKPSHASMAIGCAQRDNSLLPLQVGSDDVVYVRA